VPEVLLPDVAGPKFELLVVAGVPVPGVVVVPGDWLMLFGPLPVAAVPELVPEPVDDVCAYVTPMTATREAAAAAIVKLFGSLLIWDLLLQCESTVAMGCPLQRSAVICRCAKRLGSEWAGKRRSCP
jgi:hypothetical protein